MLANELFKSADHRQHELEVGNPESYSLRSLDEYDPHSVKLELGIVQEYFSSLGADKNIEVKPMVRAHANVECYGWFTGFGFEPPDQNSEWVTMEIPASQACHKYVCQVCVEVHLDDGGVSMRMHHKSKWKMPPRWHSAADVGKVESIQNTDRVVVQMGHAAEGAHA
jgi:hypothetical protein